MTETDDEAFVRLHVRQADPLRGQPVAGRELSPDELRQRAERRARVLKFRKLQLLITVIVLAVVLGGGWLAAMVAPMLSKR